MPTGGFIGFTCATGLASGNAGANSIFLTALVAQQNGTATAVLIQTPNATSSISFKVLIYDGSHSTLLATGSTVTATVSGYNRFPLTAPLSLTAGSTYYVGYVCSATCNVGIQTTGGTSWLVSGGQSVTSPANPLVGGAASAVNLVLAIELDGTGLQQTGFGPDYATGVTLSAANSAANFSSTANRGARSIYTQIPGVGKWYAEVTPSGVINNNVGIGIAKACWGVTQGTGGLNEVALLLPTGLSNNGANFSLTYAAGDTVGIAYDAVNNTLQFNNNNGAMTSPPRAVSAVAWPVAISVATGGTGVAANFTLRDTAALQLYAPPAGFLPWTPAPPMTARQYAVTVNSS